VIDQTRSPSTGLPAGYRMYRTHSCILVDLKARSAKGARFSAVHPRGGTSRCSNVCLWRTFAKKCPGRKRQFGRFCTCYKMAQKSVSVRGIFSQKCAIDRHLSTEKFPLWGGLLKSEHLWLNVLLNPPKYTNEFERRTTCRSVKLIPIPLLDQTCGTRGTISVVCRQLKSLNWWRSTRNTACAIWLV